MSDFKNSILTGIPKILPEKKEYDINVNHAPIRKDCLTRDEKKLAIINALRYFDKHMHAVLAQEFAQELNKYGRIYMYRFRPTYPMYARSPHEYPYQSIKARAIMMMIQNNLDPEVAQHPHELITYGGNGAVFQNWAQYLLCMQYLATMTDEQTLVLNSGHPLGLFPAHTNAPRVVITNGLMIPNYSKPDDLEKYNALGVTQYGQMTAGSFMYIGPQGIVHGTTITLLNAGRKIATKNIPLATLPASTNIQEKTTSKPAENFRKSSNEYLSGKLFISSGLGGMSGAQAKAAVISGAIGVIAEINPSVIQKRHTQGWVDEVFNDLSELIARIEQAKLRKEAVSIAYQGNIVDLWEYLANNNINVAIGSDQTSLHNPWSGGYYPVDLSFEQANELMTTNPDEFKKKVQMSLVRQVQAIDKLTAKGMYFFDYGNAFLLEASRAGADILKNGEFKYPSYVQDIMGPMCFDYGFGPFRWVCTSGTDTDLAKTDSIAQMTLERLSLNAPDEISEQLNDNILWIKEAQKNQLVVGSKARILYADAKGRIEIAKAFNAAIRNNEISSPIVLGRDHHDVSGTDSPYRETSNIYDGSQFTADMAIQNVIGDAMRGASWVSIHNGGGVGFGEAINGGFGLVLDGTTNTDELLQSMLFWDVNNGIARRNWARNEGAMNAILRAEQEEPNLRVTKPNLVNQEVLEMLCI